MQQPEIILTIAGSDSSGGAGIQADIKTISALGGYAASVITAVTAQNTKGVQGILPMPAALIGQQLSSVFEDLQPQAVKIGMLVDAKAAESIVEALKTYRPAFVIYDPVMVSTSGRRLMNETAAQYVKETLFPLCTLVTPNLNEASMLCEKQLATPEEMLCGGLQLARLCKTNILVKGGHLKGNDMNDVLCQTNGSTRKYASMKIESHNLHGTGCTLSSAIATFAAQGFPLPQAIEKAKDYITNAIQHAKDWHIGQGNGPLCHFF